MPGQAPDQEPSIEEILASIRQIISDDDEGAPAASAEPEPVVAPPPPPPPPPPKPEPPREDILVLKDPIPAERPEIVMEDISVEMEEEEEDVADVEEPLPPPVQFHDDSIFGDTAQQATVSGFAKLASGIAIDKRRHTAEGVTLEDIVRDMLQPMLREWMDENLPPMIERLVEKELERLARKALDD